MGWSASSSSQGAPPFEIPRTRSEEVAMLQAEKSERRILKLARLETSAVLMAKRYGHIGQAALREAMKALNSSDFRDQYPQNPHTLTQPREERSLTDWKEWLLR